MKAINKNNPISFELIRQFFYCKRKVYFRMVSKIKGWTTYKMKKGTEYHQKRFKRKDNIIKNLWINCEKLGIYGFIDGIRKKGNKWIIVDFKQKYPYKGKIPEDYKAQIIAEALAIEIEYGIIVEYAEIQLPGGKRIIERITVEEKQKVIEAIAEIRYIINKEILPEQTRISAKCKDCEVRKICQPL